MPYADREAYLAYQREYQRKRPSSAPRAKARRERIRDLLQEAKKRPCADCGNEYPFYVMDFDHCRGKKLFELRQAVGKSKGIQVIKDEITKCDVVCANCHRERTHQRSVA